MANSGGGGEFKSDIRKQEKMKFVSVGHHHAAGLEYAMKELGTYTWSLSILSIKMLFSRLCIWHNQLHTAAKNLRQARPP